MSLRSIGFGLIIALAGSARTSAQVAVLDETYGTGVHAYFAGAHAQAVGALTAAIDGGMKDARAYYFRGLAQARMGRLDAAEDDFAKGAAMESAEPEMTTVVSKALQRVQGQTRMRVEAHRSKARFAALSQQRARDEARYGRQRTEERGTLTKQPDKAATAEEGLFDEKTAPVEGKKVEEKAVEEVEEKVVEKKEPAKAAAPTDPFGDEAQPKAGAKKEAKEPAAKEEPAAKADDPFGEQPKAKEAPAAKEPPTAKEEEMPAEEAPATKEPPAAKKAPAATKPADKKA